MSGLFKTPFNPGAALSATSAEFSCVLCGVQIGEVQLIAECCFQVVENAALLMATLPNMPDWLVFMATRNQAEIEQRLVDQKRRVQALQAMATFGRLHGPAV